MTTYHIGTAGWTYEDWEGIFYPERPPRNFEPLAYYAQFFNLTEINATFYRVMAPRLAEKWCRDVESRPDFRFAFKLWQGLTHDQPAEFPRPQVAAIRDMAAGFIERSRFAALLMQFPWSFRFNDQSLDYLARLLDTFQDIPTAVEVRHAGWNCDRALGLLRERNVAFCNIDQPALRDCLAPTHHATANFAYLRVHGRNRDEWFNEDSGRNERYDYYYREAELDELESLARALAAQVDNVLVTTNNHYRGQAPANALALRDRLEGRLDAIPRPLAATYADLRKLTPDHPDPTPDLGMQTDLFS